MTGKNFLKPDFVMNPEWPVVLFDKKKCMRWTIENATRQCGSQIASCSILTLVASMSSICCSCPEHELNSEYWICNRYSFLLSWGDFSVIWRWGNSRICILKTWHISCTRYAYYRCSGVVGIPLVWLAGTFNSAYVTRKRSLWVHIRISFALMTK